MVVMMIMMVVLMIMMVVMMIMMVVLMIIIGHDDYNDEVDGNEMVDGGGEKTKIQHVTISMSITITITIYLNTIFLRFWSFVMNSYQATLPSISLTGGWSPSLSPSL